MAASPLEYRFYFEFARHMGFEISSDARSQAPRNATEVLITLQECTIEDAINLELEERTQQQLRSFFQTYFARHLPGVTGRAMKSNSVFGQL
jgi:hypothetical protein